MTPQTQLILSLVITAVVTSLIVWCAHWIKKNRQQHPEIYKQRTMMGAVLYMIFNLSDLF